MKKITTLNIIAAALILLNSCSGNENDLTVVSINSLNGNIFPIEKDSVKTGGMSLISSKIKEVRGKDVNRKTEIIGNSNFIYGTAEAYFTGGKAVIDLMNELNFSCLIIGHREFYFGYKELENLSASAKFPFISANLVNKDSSRIEFIKPYVILKDNITAVIGISTGKVLKANLEKDISSIAVTDPVGAVEKNIAELKAKGIRNIIVAGDFDCDINTSSNLTRDEIKRLFALTEIDLFLTTIETNKSCILSKEKPVQHSGINGSELVSFDIKDGVIINQRRHKINSETAVPDANLTDKMAEIDQMIRTITGKILGNSLDDIGHAAGDKFTYETPLGDLICDIMREYTGTDIFVMNSGKVRRGFEKGPITLGDLYGVLPYEGNLVTVEMKGSQILTMLESSCSIKMSKSFLQVSGISFSYDSSKPPMSRVIDKTVKINGKNLDINTVYSVSLTDYIFQGGDSYTEFAEMGIKLIKTHQKQMREILKDYINASVTIRAHENNRITDISKL
jgi:2',3'-cyclic-nucleotide 2'-phosphodiesterase (5'-nucleotidase family)